MVLAHPPVANPATCQWPIASYYYHSIAFNNYGFENPVPGSQVPRSQLHSIVGTSATAYGDPEDFYKTLERLRAGEHLDQVNESSRQVLEVTVQEATQTTVEASSSLASQNPVPQARADQVIMAGSDTALRQPSLWRVIKVTRTCRRRRSGSNPPGHPSSSPLRQAMP